MSKGERRMRQIVAQYPGIHIESQGKSGYVAKAASGARYRLGSFGSSQGQNRGPRGDKNFEAWCKRESGYHG